MMPAALEIRQTPLDISERTLDVGDIGANGAKLGQHQIISTVDRGVL